LFKEDFDAVLDLWLFELLLDGRLSTSLTEPLVTGAGWGVGGCLATTSTTGLGSGCMGMVTVPPSWRLITMVTLLRFIPMVAMASSTVLLSMFLPFIIRTVSPADIDEFLSAKLLG